MWIFLLWPMLVGALGLQPASAADLKAIVPKAPPPAAYDWSGLYVGANAGVGIGRTAAGLDATPAFPLNDSFFAMPVGGMAGLQAGINWQVWGVVVGAESDIQWSGQEDSHTCLAGCLGTARAALTQKMPWLGTTRARIGFIDGPVLNYYTAGLAYAGVKTSINEVNGGAAGAVQFDEMRTGWTIGSGIEAALGNGWTGKIEYLYVDLGHVDNAYVLAGVPHTLNEDIREHVFRAGLNYRIGAAATSIAAAPLARWDGFFVGGNIGSGLARNPSGLDTFAGAAQVGGDRFDLSPAGYLAGVQAGYDWQRSNLVFGLEADIQGTTFKDDRTCVLSCTSVQFAQLQQKLPWFGTARARLGYAAGPALFYATGGLAFGSVDTRVTQLNAGATADLDLRDGRVGWALGGGIETPLTLLPGWTLAGWTSKTEYLYVNLGSTTNSYSNAGLTFPLRSDLQSHVLRTGFTYRFNRGAN